jgi:DmsE family decaheme c-type cytochrome
MRVVPWRYHPGARQPPRGRRAKCGRGLRGSAVLAAVGAFAISVIGASARADEFARADPIAALSDYLQSINAVAPLSRSGDEPAQIPQAASGEFSDLSDLSYADQRQPAADLDKFDRPAAGAPSPAINHWPRLAEADNAFDALREFLQRQQQPPEGKPPPLATRRPIRPEAAEPIVVGPPIGSNACLGCHAEQAHTFSHTMMGRLAAQGKLQCETCHGPGSTHVQAVGCAACHGDGGITTRPGIPSLVGQDPHYLLTAMHEYISGQRKHALMQALLSHLGAAELESIAVYYARQAPERAQTPPVGSPSAGRAEIATCAACHGERGISINPAFPNLAGQDARYLADAIRAYRHGLRNKTVECAACHGERGISKTAGIPSLVGLDPQYLVAAMKQYALGERKNAVMRALLSGVSDVELNNMALYYAQQSPARAETPSIGDAAAGKTAAAACAGCHGAQGVSANPAWPSLAGQDARYFVAAMQDYKSGARSDAVMKALAASLDQTTIDNLAGYYAGLHPEQPGSAKGTPVKRPPVVIANRIVAALDDRAINDIASYFASQPPAQPNTAKYGPANHVPALVRTAAPVGGRSVGGIISFRPDDPGRTAEQNNGICLTCHERGERTTWHGSVHEERGVACTNCHTIMTAVSAQNQLKTPFEPDTCFQCHKDRRAQMFRSAHMPLREGKMVCSDCHNPHGSFTEALLRTDSINDTCYKCHAEKRGPFLFEHAPVRENCTNCHDPHGTVNEHMLKMSVPRLCYECHTIGHTQAGPNSQFTMSRACLNCHTNIHGSNSPAGAVFQR